MYINLIAHDTEFDHSAVRLILGQDITEKLEYEQELAKQRAKQHRIITETVIRAQEKEREEIGRELHDNVNQLLATAVLLLDFAIRKENLVSSTLQDSLNSIRMAIGEIRRLSHKLVGPALDDGDLRKALTELVSKISSAGIDFSFIDDGYTDLYPDKETGLMIYRVAQEQLSNILKHAHASKAAVELASDEDRIYLTIRDNGRGFDPGKQSPGIGLRNMTNRVHFYKGTIAIHSSPGEGCQLEIVVPVKKAQERM
ncbi:MAG: sensor histidine kinase [Chitinophagaceae bacterium]